MKILFFAWLRDTTGVAEGDFDPPADVKDVEQLIAWLRQQGDGFERAFSQMEGVRVAVNQEHVEWNHAVEPGDEVAFFPPVTGG